MVHYKRLGRFCLSIIDKSLKFKTNKSIIKNYDTSSTIELPDCLFCSFGVGFDSEDEEDFAFWDLTLRFALVVIAMCLEN